MIADQPYARQLVAPGAGRAPLALLRPDARLLGHAGPGLASLRITRPDGSAVAYRPRSERRRAAVLPARRLSGGTTAGGAIAEFDLGAARSQRGLDLRLRLRPGALTGRVRVLGSPDRRTWARFARGVVYRIPAAGSVPASSTRIVYAPVDYRFLRVEIGGAERIDGAVALPAAPAPAVAPRAVELPPRLVRTRTLAGETRVTLRLLGRPVVTSLRVETPAARLDRRFVLEEPGPSGGWVAVASGGLRRTRGTAPFALRGFASGRGTLRLRILDGADAPLPALRVRAYADGAELLLDHPGSGPLTLRYGARLAPPSYEFARLPLAAGTPAPAWRLGPEVRLPAAVPSRSLWHRHAWLGSALFVALTAVVALAALLVARRPRATREPSA